MIVIEIATGEIEVAKWRNSSHRYILIAIITNSYYHILIAIITNSYHYISIAIITANSSGKSLVYICFSVCLLCLLLLLLVWLLSCLTQAARIRIHTARNPGARNSGNSPCPGGFRPSKSRAGSGRTPRLPDSHSANGA